MTPDIVQALCTYLQKYCIKFEIHVKEKTKRQDKRLRSQDRQENKWEHNEKDDVRKNRTEEKQVKYQTVVCLYLNRV